MTYRLAQSLEQLRSQVNEAAPSRSKASDGWVGDAAHFATGNASDHNPWLTLGGVGVVTAIDITHDPHAGCDVMAIASAIVASRDRRLKYLIYTGGSGGNPGILSSTVSPWKWRTRASDDHPHHLHISVDSNAADFDSVAPWALPGSGTPAVPTQGWDDMATQAEVQAAVVAGVRSLLPELGRAPWLNTSGKSTTTRAAQLDATHRGIAVLLARDPATIDAAALAAAIPDGIAVEVANLLAKRMAS